MELNFINSDRIQLRSIINEDTDAIFLYRSLREIAKFQYWEPYTKDQALDFVNQNSYADFNKEGNWIGLAIINIDSDELIGDCSVKVFESTVEIGCNISPKYQNKGYAKEVLSLIIDHYFKRENINEVFGITDSENLASIKLMESLHMTKSPDFEEKVKCKGNWCLEHKYSLTKKNGMII